MDSHNFCAQESGPDEDHQTIHLSTVSEVVGAECEAYHWKSEVLCVQRNSNIIDAFLNDVTTLVTHDGTYGLIWDENLQPSDGKYELGVHYCGTREPERKTAFSTVAFFRDGMTGFKFAIKTIEDNTNFHSEEVKVSLINRHVNICSVYGIIVRDHNIQILLEHAGMPLNEERAWIAKVPQRLLIVAQQCFQALEVLHQSGYVHCDIKPDNIMIAKNGNDFTVKLIDFGSCQRLDTLLPYNAHTTLWYWSPEIWQALNNKRAVKCQFSMDVYALALTLYFVQTSYHLMQRIREQDIRDLMIEKPEHILLIALPETIPPELRAVMRQCLDGCPKARWSAERAVRQLTEDTAIYSENYKEKFERLYSILKNSSNISSKTTFGESAFQFSQEQINKPPCFVGSFQDMERQGVPANARSKKSANQGGNRFNRSLSRNKRLVKQPAKVKPAKKATSDKSHCPVSQTCMMGTKRETSDRNTEDKMFFCSLLLKNLALQLKPGEVRASEAPRNPMCQQEALEGLKTGPSIILGTVQDKSNTDETVAWNNAQPQIIESPSQELDLSDENIISKQERPLLNFQTTFQMNSPDIMPQINSETLVASEINVQPTEEIFQQSTVGNFNSKTNIAPEDDITFVIEAFEPDAFSGSVDDIVNSWAKMLDQDEAGSSYTDGIENGSVLDISLNQGRGEQSLALQHREVELMETDQSESSLSNRIVSTSDGVVIRAARKRMSTDHDPHEIPKKTACSDTQQKLPNFDQILS